MAEHPYLPFFPEKFFADTAHVPGDVAGYYVVLLAHAWARGGSLPDDDNQLRLMTRCHYNRWPQIRDMLRSFWFVGEDGRLHQKRLDREWKRAAAWCQNQGKDAPSGGGERGISRVSLSRRKGKKPNEINATPPESTRARALTHTHTQNSLSYDRENSEGAPAALSVRAHASPAAPSPNGESEPSPPMDDAARARIAAGFEKLAASIVNPDRLNQPAAGTVAELERSAAEEKLAQWAANPLPALSPNALASPRLGYVNGHHALPKALAAPIRKGRARRALPRGPA